MLNATQAASIAKSVDLFRGLQQEDILKIFQKGRTLNLAKDSVIFFEGATGNEMFVILGGKVALYKNKQLLTTLSFGQTFGEMAVVSNEPRSATAVAAEDCKIYVMDETLFHKLLTKRVSIELLMNIVRTLCDRLRETNKRLIS
jgi:CRP-like cAMP-binding protein